MADFPEWTLLELQQSIASSMLNTIELAAINLNQNELHSKEKRAHVESGNENASLAHDQDFVESAAVLLVAPVKNFKNRLCGYKKVAQFCGFLT